MNTLTIAYIIFIAGYLFLELFLRKGSDAKSLKRGIFDKGSTLFGGIAIVVILISLPFLSSLESGQLPNVEILSSWGIIIMIAAMLLHYWSVMTLGEYYHRTLMVSEKQKLITVGPYKYIRHPGYLGYMLAALGFGLSTANLIAIIVIFLIVIITLMYRIEQEEKMMKEAFGDEYKTYVKQTKRLIPFVY